MEDLILKGLMDFGVPTIICFYLLFRFTKSIDGLTAAINDVIKYNGEMIGGIHRIEDSQKHLTELILSKGAIDHERH